MPIKHLPPGYATRETQQQSTTGNYNVQWLQRPIQAVTYLIAHPVGRTHVWDTFLLKVAPFARMLSQKTGFPRAKARFFASERENHARQRLFLASSCPSQVFLRRVTRKNAREEELESECRFRLSSPSFKPMDRRRCSVLLPDMVQKKISLDCRADRSIQPFWHALSTRERRDERVTWSTLYLAAAGNAGCPTQGKPCKVRRHRITQREAVMAFADRGTGRACDTDTRRRGGNVLETGCVWEEGC